ncbi:ErfK/YbiS/YcfS/YnhG family protein [hydrothermal vent metagenome]|uniref:ErfK/YbiS/YcfS/YnhG family protein n=1 Tax=hydrothermal vent metagenome TaxID=652676 RepID=A0A3B1D1N3_9ZZZZ
MFNKKFLIGGGLCFLVLVIWLFASNAPKTQNSFDQDGDVNQNTEAQQIYENAVGFKEDRDLVKAKDAYQKILIDHPDYEKVEVAQTELEGLNMEIIFSNTPTPDAVMHEVVRGDTLGKLAKKYGTTIELIKQNNSLKDNIIRVGQKLRVWNTPLNIYVDKSQNILILKKNEEVLKVYTISTGKDNSTPVGTFKIITKLVDPVWFNRGVVVPPESPANALGSRWLGFDLPGYGIHGTIEPETIGQQVTAGCVRMRNEEVEELYMIIPMGTKVVVVD